MTYFLSFFYPTKTIGSKSSNRSNLTQVYCESTIFPQPQTHSIIRIDILHRVQGGSRQDHFWENTFLMIIATYKLTGIQSKTVGWNNRQQIEQRSQSIMKNNWYSARRLHKLWNLCVRLYRIYKHAHATLPHRSFYFSHSSHGEKCSLL